MMGTKVRNFAPLPEEISLENLVPEEHFYRRLEAQLDLSFVRELVEPLYAGGGRPSVDPVVFFKLQLIMFFEDLRSERQLMEVVADRLSLRWYLGYDLKSRCPITPRSPASGNAIALRSSAASSRGSSRSASMPGWCGAKSCYFDATKVEANASIGLDEVTLSSRGPSQGAPGRRVPVRTHRPPAEAKT